MPTSALLRKFRDRDPLVVVIAIIIEYPHGRDRDHDNDNDNDNDLRRSQDIRTAALVDPDYGGLQRVRGGVMRAVEIHIATGTQALARLAAGAAVLDAEEQARAARLRVAADRTMYRAAHVLLRRALSRQGPYAPAQWRFVRGAQGRPEIDTTACPDAGSLRFNLAHTPALVCCALVQGRPVGIDAECRRPMQDARAIAERFFAVEEAAAVAASGSPGSAAEAATFRALWTLKEAYIKALGRGLTMGLDGFAFRLVDGPPARIELHIGDDAAHPTAHPRAHWRCALLRVDGERCTLAVALLAAEGGRLQAFLHGSGSSQPAVPQAAPPGLDLAASTPGVELSSIHYA